jgi:ribosomal protein L11 methyltransferase
VLGALSAIGVDIDPKAVGVAYENAALNGIGRDALTVLAGDVLSDAALAAELAARQYQMVLANIVADVIIPLSRRVGQLLTPDGVFLCSGIIDARCDVVAAALRANGLAIVEKTEKNGWVAFAAKQQGCPADPLV